MSLARHLMARLRGWQPVPERHRCSFCPQPYMHLRYRPIFDDPDGQPAYEVIRRCADHPEPTTPAPPCLHVGPCPDKAPAPRPPAVSHAPKAPQPAPEAHPEPPEPVQAVCACETDPHCDVHHSTRNPPTDRPSDAWVLDHEHDARWHADEAHALAKLAELTTKHSPWAAAQHMDWST